jgi:hypothetical protein
MMLVASNPTAPFFVRARNLCAVHLLCNAAAEPGSRQSFTKAARRHVRAAFFIDVARIEYRQIIQGQPRLWKIDDAGDQAAVQSAYS